LLLQGPGETKAHFERNKPRERRGKRKRKTTAKAARETRQTQLDGKRQKGTDNKEGKK
jgi:hypothetical protein